MSQPSLGDAFRKKQQENVKREREEAARKEQERRDNQHAVRLTQTEEGLQERLTQLGARLQDAMDAADRGESYKFPRLDDVKIYESDKRVEWEEIIALEPYKKLHQLCKETDVYLAITKHYEPETESRDPDMMGYKWGGYYYLSFAVDLEKPYPKDVPGAKPASGPKHW